MVSSRRSELLRLLDSYEPSPSEEPALAEMVLLLSEAADPLSRYTFDPGHFTASGCVVAPEGDAILLIHHKRLDRWLQPGGHIDPSDESAMAAARREVFEETGVPVAGVEARLLDLDIHPIPPGKGEPRHRHFDLRFLFQAASEALAPAVAEVNEVAWVRFADVDERSVETSLRRMAHKAAVAG